MKNIDFALKNTAFLRFFGIFLVFPRNQENLEAAGARLVKVPENQKNHENQEKY